MPITKGTKEATDIFYGETEIQEVRLGETLKYIANKIIYLGTGTSFNVASVYSKYRELTADNFFFLNMGNASASDRVNGTGYLTITGDFYKSYNPNTGILTMFNACGNSTDLMSANKGSVSAYLITKPQKLVNLGYGFSFNVSNYPNFRQFTADNFFIQTIPYHSGGYPHYILHNSRTYDGQWYADGNTTFTKSYNASNGVLTINYRLYAIADGGIDQNTTNMGAYVTLNPKV